jgi:chorismate dehydratase
MIFGKIDYLNLLPFHIFIKRYMNSSRLHTSIQFKKGVPSQINHAFRNRRIDAAFVSSVESKKYRCLDLGIVANKEVLSVLLIPNDEHIEDQASATSNRLAKKLGLKGQVLIGDAALKYQLQHDDAIDLAELWYKKHQLPFVFATLCYHHKGDYLERLSKRFLRRKVPIPYYLLKKASEKSGVSMHDIRHYLTKISYEVTPQAKRSLYKFLKK